MFELFLPDAAQILRDFGVGAKAAALAELQRYHYEREDPSSKEVRLIAKVETVGGPTLVLRLKNEADAPRQLIEAQCRFAQTLRDNGVPCPAQFQAEGAFTREYHLHGYDVIVTVEEYVEGEIKCVTLPIAEQTGRLLAQTHSLSERFNCHVDGEVLFDPFQENDLFKYEAFRDTAGDLDGEELALHREITEKCSEYLRLLSPLTAEPRYAVQGDLSDCNTYLLADGRVGIFDFNRCGDNNLYCDAVMQAVFEARLMDYPHDRPEDYEERVLAAFLAGYSSLRPFTPRQRELFPYLYAVIDAFWAADIRWNDDSYLNALQAGDRPAVGRWLREIRRRLFRLRPFPQND